MAVLKKKSYFYHFILLESCCEHLDCFMVCTHWYIIHLCKLELLSYFLSQFLVFVLPECFQ